MEIDSWLLNFKKVIGLQWEPCHGLRIKINMVYVIFVVSCLMQLELTKEI